MNKRKLIFCVILLTVAAMMMASCIKLEKDSAEKKSADTAEPAKSQKKSESKTESKAKTEKKQKPTQKNKIEPAAETAKKSAGEEKPAVKPVTKPIPVYPGNDDKKAKADEARGIYPISINEPREYLNVSGFNFKRVSRDKVELKEFTLTFRNIENEKIFPVVVMILEDTFDEGAKRTVEKEFPVPPLEPNTKFVSVFPLGVYYHLIENKKAITTYFYRKYESPKSYSAKRKISLVPMEMLKSLEIDWM